MTSDAVANAMDTTAEAPPKATRREWVGLGAIALACMLYVMDLTVLHLAIPEISADLQPSSTQLLWIIDIYGFVVAGSLITMGTLGDRIGRRRLLMIGAAAFGAASVLAALSSSSEMLIGTRALLGGRSDDRAVDPVVDPQHVPRSGRADPGDRDLDHELLGGRGDRTALGGLVLEFCGVPRSW